MITFIISIVIFLAISFVGGFSLNLKLIIGSLVYFIASFYVVKLSSFTNKLLPFSIIIFPPLFVFLFFNIFRFKDTSVSFPSSLFIIISSISGFLFSKNNNFIIPIFLILLGVLWLSYLQIPYNNLRLYKTYNQKVIFKYPDVNIYDTSSLLRHFSESDKYYFLDFWNSGCGPCFRLFPYIDSINKLADTSKFEFFTVNIPIRKELKENNYKILDSFGYSFKKLYAAVISVADSFRVEYYPTTIVVKNNQVIFRGNFKNAIKRFKVTE